ncbi:cobamide remodeling phosphodiesterase CbiR [Fervidobacterium sp.]
MTVQTVQMIGTTSWVIPGTYLENVEYITKNFSQIHFIELLIYTWDTETYNLLEKEKKYLQKLAETKQIRYTVHLPTDNFYNVIRAFEYLEDALEIENYVVHPFFDDFESEEMKKLLLHRKISFENLKEKFVHYKRTVFDIGHHLLGKKVDDKFLESVVEIHLMGVEDEKDHQIVNLETLEEIYSLFSYKLFTTKYICFEVFSEEGLEESLNVWNEFKRQKWGA